MIFQDLSFQKVARLYKDILIYAVFVLNFNHLINSSLNLLSYLLARIALSYEQGKDGKRIAVDFGFTVIFIE